MPDSCEPIGEIDENMLIEIGTGLAAGTSDGNSFQERSVDELIKLDQYLAAKKAAARSTDAWGNVGIARVVPPDAAGVQ